MSLSNHVPSWIPAWQGAEQIAQDLDAEALRTAARKLVDLVLTDDTIVLDSLPEAVESNLVTPLTILVSVLDKPSSTLELVVAARLVRQSALLSLCPPELGVLIRQLPD
ncbi:hypothetical protein ABT061_32080 [Streptosporangium sp. NPDC002544]|uniref:hypothetical protein n=1 Tax=Streptosporangium sp. NPDC002544 TaxID=3154538 RepID=UPI0033204FCA